MHFAEWNYGIYLTVSIAVTIWVARTLYKNGKIFILDACNGNEELADSLNHLLVVGFYLINIGFVASALRFGGKPIDFAEMIEFVSTKIGIVLLVLGAMHFFNLFLFSKLRRRHRQHQKHEGDHKSRFDAMVQPPIVQVNDLQ